MKHVSRPPEKGSGRSDRNPFSAPPALETSALFHIDAHPSLTNITAPDRKPLNSLFEKLATAFRSRGYEIYYEDMEMEWMRDSEGYNKDLQARFEVREDKRTIAAVELRSIRAECDLIMVCHSSQTDAAKAQLVKGVLAAATNG